ncbi:MAG TPA: GAF domain-containing protein [Acidimicrobiales bacterium]|nr:GAF domain-containing protein [Acidimicrobiales bacterium]
MSGSDNEGLAHRIRVVASAVMAATSVDEALRSTLKLVSEETAWPIGHVLAITPEGDALVSTGIWQDDDAGRHSELIAVMSRTRFGPGVGLAGRILATGQPSWTADLESEPGWPGPTT